MAIKPQVIVGGLALAWLMMPKSAGAAPPRTEPPRLPPAPTPSPDQGPYQEPAGPDAGVLGTQEDLNDLRDFLLIAQEEYGTRGPRGVYEPFNARTVNNGPAGTCGSVGALVEDGIDGACTQNADNTAERILYSAWVLETLPRVVVALEVGDGLTMTDTDPPVKESYENTMKWLAEVMEFLHDDNVI